MSQHQYRWDLEQRHASTSRQLCQTRQLLQLPQLRQLLQTMMTEEHEQLGGKQMKAVSPECIRSGSAGVAELAEN